MKNICVYCAATNDVREIFYKDAKEIGKLIAQNGYNLIYGGSKLGLMGAVSQSAQEHGGHVCGIMPKKIFEAISKDKGNVSEFILTEDIHERKNLLDSKSDAVITLAGGFGTLDELAEIIDLKKIGYNSKPIVILNTDGFYDNLITFFNKIIAENFAKPNANVIYYVANTPEDAINYIKNYKITNTNSYLHYSEK